MRGHRRRHACPAMLAALALAMLLHTAAAHEVAEVRGYQQAVREGEQLDVHVYLSPLQDPFYRSGQLFNASKTPGALVYKNSTTFGWNVVTESVSINVSIPDTVQRNRSSLFAHVFVSRKGVSPNPWDPANKQLDYPFHVMLRSVDLTHRLPEKQVVKAIKRNLLYDPVQAIARACTAFSSSLRLACLRACLRAQKHQCLQRQFLRHSVA